MTAGAPARPRPPGPATTSTGTAPWAVALAAGAAVLLAGAPVSAVVQGGRWATYAVAVVVTVVAVGLLLHRAGAAVVAAGQCAAILVVLTATFAEDGVLGVLPGPAALAEFGALLSGAAAQIDTGTAPVPATPEIHYLVTAAFGLLAVAVYLTAVGAGAPAAAGVPLLAVFAVPAALADELLPWWAVAAAAGGFGLLLLARDGGGRLLPGGVAVVAGAVVLALGLGAGAGFVGTAGRFEAGTGPGGSGGAIGLSPFTSLRGQLERTDPVELLRVRGLPRATYLRALTLRDYVPGTGWQAGRPDPGTPLPGPVPGAPAAPVEAVEVSVENVAFRDYWLPLYGVPLEIAEIPVDRWVYDTRSGTAYTARPTEEDGWRQRAEFGAPSAEQLRAADDTRSADDPYLAVAGVDPRVGRLAAEITGGAGTPFDRALALQEFFTGPDSAFSYSLQTAPGGGDDALVEFLTAGRTGYCEQYASAMAVMLRTVGVPARVAVGFTGGVDEGDHRSISTADAHAWVEAWFPGVGWTAFDPTPLTDGRAITPPYVEEARAGAAGADGAVPEAAPLPEAPAAGPTAAPAAPEEIDPAAATPAGDSGGLPWWPFVLVPLLALAALGPAGLRERQRRRRMAAVAAGGPDAAGAGWAELLAESADRGSPTPPTETVRATARRLVREHHLDDTAQRALRQVIGAVEASWYGDLPADPSTLDAPVRAVRDGIAAGSGLRIRDRLLPRSVLTRAPRAGADNENTAALG